VVMLLEFFCPIDLMKKIVMSKLNALLCNKAIASVETKLDGGDH